MANWPATLPTPIASSVSYKPQQANSIRTDFPAGVAKMRRRFTAVAEDFSGRILINQAQIAILDDFVQNTLADVLPFTWSDFRRPIGPANARQYRFKARPEYSRADVPGEWFADLQLEMLP